MPDVTLNLGLKKPLGNETISRAAYNENLDIMDQNAAKAVDLAAHLADTAPHSNYVVQKSGINTMTGQLSIGPNAPIANYALDINKLKGVLSGYNRVTTSDGVDDRVGYFLHRRDGDAGPNGLWMNSNAGGAGPEYWENVVIGVTGGGGHIVFMTSLTERMRIAADGAVTIAGSTVWHAGNAGPFYIGAGSPEGVVTAPVGAIYQRTDGGAGTTLYVKQSGTGNTGWVAK